MLTKEIDQQIVTAINTHYKTVLAAYQCYFGGAPKLPTTKSWVEIRVSGPDWSRKSVGECNATVFADLLVNVADSSDLYLPNKITGLIVANTYAISVKDSDDKIIGCLKIDSEIITRHLGKIEENLELRRSLVDVVFAFEAN